MSRWRRILLGAIAFTLAAAAPAYAHGLVGRQDLPIPEIVFLWAAAAVLVISFAALALLWTTVQLENREPRALARIPRWLEVVCGAIGVAAFAGVVYAGLSGSQTPTANAAPTVIYVVFWVGVPIVSAVFGDVFRAFSPWRAIGRAVGWGLHRVMADTPAPLVYPERLGRWPAALGVLAFGWVELVAANGDKPSVLAILAITYFVTMLFGMSLFGVETWVERADPFGVYFSMFARISPLTTERGYLAWQRPLSGLTRIRWLPGTVPLLCVAIGVTAFDGASAGPRWNSISMTLQDAFVSLGFSLGTSLQLAFTIGLILMTLIIGGFYRLGIQGVHLEARERSAGELAARFAHSLIPIALAYLVAHYFSLFVYQGQAMIYLVSDPLGEGADLFGTADNGIDYGLVSAVAIRYVQVGALVIGHVAALVVAHDRALAEFGATQKAVRSQYWMLAVMVGFTTLGLWLLSEANG